MNIGVIGAGTIASWMSDFLEQIQDQGIVRYGVATGNPEKCKKFAEENGWQHVYSSIDEMLADPAVDLVYIAVPNNAHYDMCMKALNFGKNVVVEKPFAVNAAQAEAMLSKAKEKDVFISEALWPSFLPSCEMINEVIASGEIGTVTGGKMVSLADVMFLDRVKKLETGGGALMDMGPYMVGRVCDHFGTDIVKVTGRFELLDSGVDAKDWYTIEFANGVKVDCISTINTPREEYQEYGEIYGTEGSIWFDAMSNPHDIRVLDKNGKLKRQLEIPPQFRGKKVPFTAGYEYEWLAFRKALAEGEKECSEASHALTLAVAETLTELRKQAGVIFPFE